MAIYKCRCGHPSCNQFTLGDQGSVGFEKPRALLYDAADDLLAALKAAKLLMENDPNRARDGWMAGTYREVCAALAKAEGTEA